MNRAGLAELLLVLILSCANAVAQTTDDQLVRDLEAKLCSPTGQPEDVVSDGDVAALRKIQAERRAELNRLGTRGVDALLKMSQSKDMNIQSCGLVYLVQMRDLRAKPILRHISSQNSYPKAYRVSAISQLGALRDAESTGLLIKMLEGNDPDVIRVAIQALGSIGDNQAKTVLRSALTDPKYTAGWTAVIVLALGKAHDNASVPAIVDLAGRQSSPYGLDPYLIALAEIGTPTAMEHLTKLIEASPVGDRQRHILSIYGRLMGDKEETSDVAEKERLQRVISQLCALQERACS